MFTWLVLLMTNLGMCAMHPLTHSLTHTHLQDREVARLRSETLALAAQAAAEGGLGSQASAEAAEMAQRVIDLEQRSAALQVKWHMQS